MGILDRLEYTAREKKFFWAIVILAIIGFGCFIGLILVFAIPHPTWGTNGFIVAGVLILVMVAAFWVVKKLQNLLRSARSLRMVAGESKTLKAIRGERADGSTGGVGGYSNQEILARLKPHWYFVACPIFWIARIGYLTNTTHDPKIRRNLFLYGFIFVFGIAISFILTIIALLDFLYFKGIINSGTENGNAIMYSSSSIALVGLIAFAIVFCAFSLVSPSLYYRFAQKQINK